MPDFGIMRGFNEKLFGDKLVAGQLPTQLGLIGSFSDVDPDAQAFFDRVTAATGTLSATEIAAVNTLVIQMKADNIWNSMKAIYPMVGASAAACAQNLKSSSFTGAFYGGNTFASTGFTPNGTTGYMDTNYNASVDSSLNSAHASYYSRTNTTNLGEDMGTYGSAGQQIGYAYNSTLNFIAFNSIEFAGPIFSPTIGLLLATRISSTTTKWFHRNNSPYSDNQTSTSLKNANLFLGGLNFLGNLFLPSTKECAFASIGDGLTDTQAANLYTAVEAFQTTLSRQV
jgi:hypothetical protein